MSQEGGVSVPDTGHITVDVRGGDGVRVFIISDVCRVGVDDR